MMVKKAKLLAADLTEKSTLHPEKESITFHLHSPHQAQMIISAQDSDVALQDWVRLYTADGDAGIFLVNSRSGIVGKNLTIGLRHGICILARDKPRLGDEPIYGTLAELLNRFWTADGVNTASAYWMLGTIPDTGVLKYDPSGENLLQAVETLLKTARSYRWELDQSVFPWQINIVPLTYIPTSEGRFSRNLSGVEINEDNYDLVTRVYLAGREGYTDADTIGRWGVFSEELRVGDDATEESIAAYVADYLEAHKNPNVSIRLGAVDMSNITGETFDRFRLGDMCQACLPDYGTTILERVISIEYPDVYGSPDERVLSMSNKVETTPDLLVYNEREVVSSSRSIGRRISDAEKQIIINAEYIQINAKELDVKADITRLQAVEAELVDVQSILSGEVYAKSMGVSERFYAENVNFPGSISLKNELADWEDVEFCTDGSVSVISTTSLTVWDSAGNPIGSVKGIPSKFYFSPKTTTYRLLSS